MALLGLAAVVLLGGLALLAERLIVTDEEAIRGLADRARDAVVRRDPDALLELLTEDFRTGRRDGPATAKRVARLWDRYRPSGLTIDLPALVVAGDEAEGRIDAIAWVAGRPQLVRVEFGCVRTANGWRFESARIDR